ncbi:phosphotransferase [Frigoribacterium sp. 2-23]|uniref:phosphotransferase n=1 Tax=Frigoribacterium sp. 2-23 TaxID=3415006 RepID=UPI003C701BFC
MDEEVLTGGNSSDVSRVGSTVHRTAGPWTPAVHELLRVLRRAGVVEVPEPLGFDDDGREVLSFMPGAVGNYPLPTWLWEESILSSAGALLRRVHDASAPLVEADVTWGFPRHEPAEVVCHNDVAPYNMTFDDGRATGLFDFDTASPGPRLWDLAYLAYRLAPLGEHADVALDAQERHARVERLVQAYGIPYETPDLLTMLAERLLALADFTDERLRDTGNPEFADHAAMYRRDAASASAMAGRASGSR